MVLIKKQLLAILMLIANAMHGHERFKATCSVIAIAKMKVEEFL